MTNRQEVLDLLANGKINADEAADMLASIEAKTPETPIGFAAKEEPLKAETGGKTPSWLHVRVKNMETGQNKVTVNIPLRMLNFGLKIGSRFAPELAGLDYEELSGLMRDVGGGMLVEVEDEESNEHVQVYVK